MILKSLLFFNIHFKPVEKQTLDNSVNGQCQLQNVGYICNTCIYWKSDIIVPDMLFRETKTSGSYNKKWCQFLTKYGTETSIVSVWGKEQNNSFIAIETVKNQIQILYFFPFRHHKI